MASHGDIEESRLSRDGCLTIDAWRGF